MVIVGSKRRGRRTAHKVSFRTSPLEPCSAQWQTLEDSLEPDHLARIIARVVNRLDLSDLWTLYAGFGSPAYPPHLLLAAMLFEIQRGHHSPAQWYRHAKESLPLRWLLRGLVPSRACWYQFRDRLGPALLALVHQAVRQAIAEGFTPARRAALDGTLLAANASRHKLLNEKVLAQRCQQLQQAVAADKAVGPAVAPADPAGELPTAAPTPPPQTMAADKASAAAAPPRWLAATPRGRRWQAERYSKAKDEMSRRQDRNRQKRASQRTAAERIVIAPADPEAALGRDKEKVFRPLYNAQVLDDLDSPLILSWLTVAQPNDAGLIGSVLRQANTGLGVTIEAVAADASYAGGADLAAAEELGATVYAPWQSNDFSVKKEDKYYPKEKFKWLAEQRVYQCPQGQQLTYQGSSRQKRSSTQKIELQMYRGEPATCAACPVRSKCTPGKGARTISRSEYEEHLEALRERMKGEEAKRLYRLRKQTVELANADMKGNRGLRRLSGRGLKRADAQVGLTVLAHDLVVLDGLRSKRQQGAAVATPCTPSS
jgi:transposase